ncbi:MAG: hypothetical protein RL685_3671 [Pseudomonadota bacterium]|jgi:hypothetical protein
MTYSLLWLPDVLRNVGLKVAVVDGWEARGRGDVGNTLGVLCHHTGGPKHGNMPSLRVLLDGRQNLVGPLAQLALGRDGTYYVIAAGRCNHAGPGAWNGVTNGNLHFIGIEAENTGTSSDWPWPTVQVDAYQRGVAAILRRLGLSAASCAGHKEYALPRGRKPDPSLDMDAFRASVAAWISGAALAPTLIPATEPPTGAGAGRPTLRRGSRSDLVSPIQRKLGISVDGEFGGQTEAALRAFQRSRSLVPDGIIGPRTWAVLDTIT